MARIFPFRAYRYDDARFDLARVLTQPYDKITSEMQERYYALDPHNLVRIEKGRPEPDDGPQSSVYTRAAQTLDDWIREGALRQDAAASLYVCSQEFTVPGPAQREEHRVRRGFLALLGLEDYSAGVVFRHEQTHTAARVDRLELLRHTRAHTGQLLMLFDDAGARLTSLIARVMRAAPESEVKDEFGVIHRLWPVSDAAVVDTFVRAMADLKLLIADGHHRYETALAYRDECRARGAGSAPEAPHEKTLVTLFPLQDQGVVVLPTHRTVSGLAGFNFTAFRKSLEGIFDWYAYPFAGDSQRDTALAEFRHDLAAQVKGEAARRAIGVYAGGGAYFLFVLSPAADLAELLAHVPPAQRSLDVVLLHRLLFERKLGLTPDAVEREKNISYHRDIAAALAAVDSGAAQIAFLLNPVSARQVFEIALSGNVLPQKSTDFYPKLLSGLAIYRLDG
ncbi:MAG TPA: DUF1015 domain-containing protein [Candidatus Acidoferrales bacterium]|nr:DUF1015 domain-containing protein [Candidatus Acidoferrales bacterium]